MWVAVFVAEMGGHGCVKTLVSALIRGPRRCREM
jgi:hypothetical protein